MMCTMISKHSFRDYLYWIALASIPGLTAAIGVGSESLNALCFLFLVWVVAFGIIYRALCVHCPYYIKSEGTIKCMYWWWMPKFFKANPDPPGKFAKVITLISIIIMALFPLYWLFQKPGLLAIYLLSGAVLSASSLRYACKQCLYYECPSNRVPEESRPLINIE